MAQVRYKEITESLSKIAKPNQTSGRVSIGLEQNIGEFYFLNIEDLLPFKNQARTSFAENEIKSLADSISKHGIRHPLTVIFSEIEKGKYEVISGERRLRAAKLAGLNKVPCIILKEKELAEEIAIVENIHRQDLHPIELGMAFNYLLKKNICVTQEDISKKLSIPKSVVSEHLNFITLPGEVKDFLIKNKISSRDKLRKFVKVKDDENALNNLMWMFKSGSPTGFSVIRVTCGANRKLKFQSTGLQKLDEIQKVHLKDMLHQLLTQI